MRRRLALVPMLLLLSLVPAAHAKGPTSMSVTGPGLSEPIRVSALSDPQGTSHYWKLVDGLGFFPAAFRQVPSPLLPARPQGDLGPKYTIRHGVPVRNGKHVVILQELYPYARGGPLTHMLPGQKLFGRETTDGWFRTGSGVKAAFVVRGLPAVPPTSEPGSGRRSVAATGGVALLGGLLGALGIAAMRRRRRFRPTTV